MSALYNELERTLLEVKHQIHIVEHEASQFPGAYEKGIDPALLKDRSGNYILAPLLVAKAQCLLGMAQLKSAKEAKR